MPSLPQQPVGSDAQLFVNPFGEAILYLQPMPSRNGDLLVTDDIGAPNPIWRPLEFTAYVMEPHNQLLECRDPHARRRWVLRLRGGAVWVDGVEHSLSQFGMRMITVLPFPEQRLLKCVLENRETGTRIALYGDPNVPLSRRAWIRVGDRARPNRWNWARYARVSSDEQVVETELGTLELGPCLWRKGVLHEVSRRAHGLPPEDEWGQPLARTWSADSTWALLALGTLILGIVLGVALGYAL